jgi:hypothetical protein
MATVQKPCMLKTIAMTAVWSRQRLAAWGLRSLAFVKAAQGIGEAGYGFVNLLSISPSEGKSSAAFLCPKNTSRNVYNSSSD